MMGHTNISTTQVYAKVTDDKISEDMDRLIERRKAPNKNALEIRGHFRLKGKRGTTYPHALR